MSLLIYNKIKSNGLSEKVIKKIVGKTLEAIDKNLNDYDMSIHLVGEKYIKNLVS